MDETLSISVVVTTYNRADKLRRMLESITRQTIAPDEIVVVNDGSRTDYTSVKQWAKSLPNLTWKDVLNNGVSSARNLGIQTTASTFIAFCDDDDYFLPDHIDQLSKRIRSEDLIPGIYHTYRMELRGTEFSDPPISRKTPQTSWQEYYITAGEMIPSCTCMHKDVALQFPFPSGIKYAEDHEQRLLALSAYPCYPIYERTVVMDRTDETATNRPVGQIAEIYRDRFHTMFSDPLIRTNIRKKYRHQMLYRWTSLELADARRNARSTYPLLLVKALFRVRTWSNLKTWMMNLIWFFKAN